MSVTQSNAGAESAIASLYVDMNTTSGTNARHSRLIPNKLQEQLLRLIDGITAGSGFNISTNSLTAGKAVDIISSSADTSSEV